jgi:hypothetical protein
LFLARNENALVVKLSAEEHLLKAPSFIARMSSLPGFPISGGVWGDPQAPGVGKNRIIVLIHLSQSNINWGQFGGEFCQHRAKIEIFVAEVTR